MADAIILSRRRTKPKGKILGDMEIGSSVFFGVGGVRTEFLVVHKGAPSAKYDVSYNDGVILLSKDGYGTNSWAYTTSYANRYEASPMHRYLNDDYFNLIDAGIRSLIKKVKIPHRAGAGTSFTVSWGASGLECNIFSPRSFEVGTGPASWMPEDGAVFSYFADKIGIAANSKRAIYANGKVTTWWLRTPYVQSAVNAWYIESDGSANAYQCPYSFPMRPAMVFPAQALVSDDNTVMPIG